MSALSDAMGDLWPIVEDLVFFEHGTCFNCQPFESGEPVWLTSPRRVEQVATQTVELVAAVNGHELPKDWADLVADAVDDDDWSCPCGQDLGAHDEIGGNLFDEGIAPERAHHLLTQAHWPFLTHYTSGPDAFASILRDRSIRASDKFITDAHKVVCLTECSPLEIRELVRLRSAADDVDERARWKQLGHAKMGWSKSTWGIAFNRGGLVMCGARPAIHGDESVRDALPPSERHRFVRFEHRPHFADWTFEREFRVVGDLPLDGLLARKTFLIVPTRAEQKRLLASANVPPWPIMPLDWPLGAHEPMPRSTRRQARLLASLTGG